ncbi:type II toxin-antitoxin system death-on-curing family toxin [Carnobacterium sp.]|uniref:type II toxin-antitoxin system death-on-curing family toxin n=1 Tax=Carnobacterium sp. TaxID=48221 RepID=UPI0028B14884|nr:type II toxin-antitoxin system death-on-curing family toxin [Carnobacterium sp.]
MIRYLSEKEIILINVIQIETYSNQEQVGVKEPSALNMCLEQPKQEVFGEILYPTVEDKAAILFELLINKNCFYNANKRTASMALYTFLELNEIDLAAEQNELVEFAVSIAKKRGKEQTTHEDIVEWIKKHSRKK